MKYGLIGLGNLGTNIAKNLISSGFKLVVHDKNRNNFRTQEKALNMVDIFVIHDISTLLNYR